MPETKNEWETVPEIQDVDVVFGANIDKYPTRDEIPEQFWRGYTVWNRLFNEWFFKGIDPSVFVPKLGIDKLAAIRYISSLMCSFEPKHEHKEAAVAYLMSLWFEEPKK